MANKKKKNWIFGGVIIAVVVVAASFLQLGDTMVYFYKPEEIVMKAKELQHDTVKVGGMVKIGTKSFNPETHELDFILTNMDGVEIAVNHKGTPPDLFKEEAGVVVEGRISEDGKSFQAKTLMVKHSEEYRAPEDHANMDKVLIEKSLFKE